MKKGINRGKEYFIRCECGSECLHVEKDECDNDIYFSLWFYGCQELSWKNKLHWIWNIIKGMPYFDTVIVDNSRIQEVIDVLESMKVKKNDGE